MVIDYSTWKHGAEFRLKQGKGRLKLPQPPIETGYKTCIWCLTTKKAEEFVKNSRCEGGRANRCRECDRERLRDNRKRLGNEAGQRRARKSRLKSLFGLTVEQYDEMLDQQKGVCKICGRPCSSGRRLAVDHCHETGKIRGLLCGNCNKGIGNFQDSVPVLRSAIEYLES